jgi:FAD:protein FMN transferase
MLINSHSHTLATLAANAARAEIERLNRVLNHRRSDSEISELNRARRGQASADLFAVLQLSETWRHISHGAFDGRMGELLRLWMTDAEPDRSAIERTLAALRASAIALDPIKRWVELSSAVALSLDAVAKGYIVDAALDSACRAAPIEGMAIGIGGDIRCFGRSPDPRGWRIGIPDPIVAAENAPLVDAVSVRNAAIATSGRGPRDFIGNGYRSTTISPLTGRPVCNVVSASVVASHAADADAIATACMVLHPEESIPLVNKLGGVAARITDAQGRVHRSAGWSTIQLAATTPAPIAVSPKSEKPSLPPALQWPADWEVGITYSEPDRKEQQTADFRVPYIAVWITDAQNKPVSTVFMLGTAPQWHRDNFIWWGIHSARAEQLVDLRSQATTLSGSYRIYWPGVDDDWKPMPVGKYILHLETSQERGKHNYRNLTLEIGRQRFKTTLPNLPNEGGLEITYGHYNDRFKSD